MMSDPQLGANYGQGTLKITVGTLLGMVLGDCAIKFGSRNVLLDRKWWFPHFYEQLNFTEEKQTNKQINEQWKQ